MLRSACATVSQSNSLQSQFIHSRLEFQASPVHFFTRYSNQLILLRSASWPSHMGHRIPCKVSQSIHAWNSESWQYNASRDVLSIVSTPCLRIELLLKQKTQLILLRSASWPSHMGHRIPCKVSQSIHACYSKSWRYNASRGIHSIVSTPCLAIVMARGTPHSVKPE